MPRHPALRRRNHRLHRAADELDLELAHGQLATVRLDAAFVERELDLAVGRAQRALAAQDVGAEDAAERRARLQQIRQAVPDRHDRMQRGVDRRRLARGDDERHVVLGACHPVVAAALQGLHPAPSFAAHPQREACLGQRAVGGVVVGRLQPLSRPALAPGDGLVDGVARGRRHLEFELDFMHDRTVTADRPKFDESVDDAALFCGSPTFAPRSAVSFLDDLQRQAAALKAQQSTDSAALARNTSLTEVACRTVLNYFMTLASQLNVLRPVSPTRFALDRKHVFEGLKLTDFRVDSRLKTLRNEEVFEHLVLHWKLPSGQKLAIVKDFLPDIEKIEPRLRQSGAQVDAEAIRHPDNGRLQGMRYELVADFFGNVRITPKHDTAVLQFEINNVDGFETVALELPAIEVGGKRLDELARWLAGHPHAFLKDVSSLRRTEA
jgi:hypothetical protein